MPGIGIGLGLGMGVGKPQASLFNRVRQALFGSGEQGIYMPSVHESFLRGDLFQDAAGTIPVTSVGQPVGLWLDRSKGLELGPELVVNGDFSDGLTGWRKVGELGDSYLDGHSCIVEHTGASAWSAREQNLSSKITTGRTYVLEADITLLQAGSAFMGLWTGATVQGPLHTGSVGERKHYRWVYTTSSPTFFVVRIATYDNGHARFENVSVRELPGNHASQATSAARPVYRASPSRLDFDEVDDKLTATFASSLGEDCTVALSIPGVGASILTGQTIGTSYDITTDNCGIVIVDRALTTDEADRLTALLNASAGV